MKKKIEKKSSKKLLILNGTDNDSKRCRYSFEKNEAFRKGLIEFMKRLQFNEKELKNIEEKFSYEIEGEDGEEIKVRLKVSAIKDVCWHFENSKYDVDVFFGLRKIVVVVRVKRKQNRERLVDALESMVGWISEEEKKVRNEKGKDRIKIKRVAAK